MPASDTVTCHCCGIALSTDNLAWDYGWPDDLAALPDEQRGAVLKFYSRVFLIAEGYGAAIRVILPIRLDTGHTVTLGVWLTIQGGQEEFDRIVSTARDGGDAWVGFTFSGALLNAVAPWPETYLANVTAVGQAANQLAHIVDSTQDTVKRVLTEIWPHEQVIRARQMG